MRLVLYQHSCTSNSIFYKPGWQDEVARNGCKTKLWSSNGWNNVWWLKVLNLTCTLFLFYSLWILYLFTPNIEHTMAQAEEELTFFEKERDRLSREITSVSPRSYTSNLYFGLIAMLPGIWRSAFINKCVEPQTWRSFRNDKRIQHHCCFVAQFLSTHA